MSSMRSKLAASGSLEAVYANSLKPYDGPLTAKALMAEAEASTGLSDWGGEALGEPGFRFRFEKICEAIAAESHLNTLGVSRCHSRFHMMLCSRLRVVAWTKSGERGPPIRDPLIGTGFPRAGTSFFHQVIGQDPDNLSANAAEAAIPIPPPAFIADETERLTLMQKLFDAQGFDSPAANAIHPFETDAPEECVNMQETAVGTAYQAFYNVPSFLAAAQPTIPDLYAWQQAVMQALQEGRTFARWALKTPDHIGNWETMVRTYPGARVFINHRDPGKVIASICSLYVTFQSLNSDGAVDPKVLGRPSLERLAAVMDKVTAWRAARPEFPVVDVHYKTMIADPIAEAERVYAAFGLTLSAKARDRMASFLKTHRHGGHGQAKAHDYKLADFGLTEADIEAVCGRYLDQFGVAREERR
jgi:hypothetical protein